MKQPLVLIKMDSATMLVSKSETPRSSQWRPTEPLCLEALKV